MKKKKKLKENKLAIEDYVKAARKGSREAEIEMYGHPINYRKVFQSKKVYNRKKIKANNNEGSPFFYKLPL